MAKTTASKKSKSAAKTKSLKSSPSPSTTGISKSHASRKSVVELKVLPRPRRRQTTTKRRRKAYVDEPPNSRGLPSLPDELLLEIISYFPSIIPNPSNSDHRHARGSGFGRRNALVALSLLCSNLRRFCMPYIFETIEVYPGTLVDCGVKKPPLILGGPLGDYVMNKHFATELLRQLDTVTQRKPELRFSVKTVSVELRDFKPQQVAEELVRCLSLFPNLRALRLRVLFPHQKAHLPTPLLHFNPSVFDNTYLPSVQSALVCHQSFRILRVCPNVKAVWGFGLSAQEESNIQTLVLQHCFSVKTLYIRQVTYQVDVMNFQNLRHLIINDCFPTQVNTIITRQMVEFLRYPNFPRLRSVHVIVSCYLKRKTLSMDNVNMLEQDLRDRQLMDNEDKSIYVEYHYAQDGLSNFYITLCKDGDRISHDMGLKEYNARCHDNYVP